MGKDDVGSRDDDDDDGPFLHRCRCTGSGCGKAKQGQRLLAGQHKPLSRAAAAALNRTPGSSHSVGGSAK